MKKLIVIFCAAILALTACDGNSITPEGDVIIETYQVSNFHSVRIAIPADVQFVQSNSRLVEIEANENLFDVFDVKVTNGVLTIDSDENIRNPRTINIYLQETDIDLMSLSGSGSVDFPSCVDTDELELSTTGSGDISICGIINNLDLKISGSGNISGQDLTLRNLITQTTGSGDIELLGSGINGTYRITGSGRINAYDMILETVDVNISGSGDIQTTATTDLNVNISGSGDVNYKGDPSITSNISGSGRVRDAN